MAETKKYVQIINGCYVKDTEARAKADEVAQNLSTLSGTVSSNTTLAGEAKSLAEEAKAIAEGKTYAKVYNDFQALVNDLLDTSTNYAIGTQLLVKATDCPDYWVTDNTCNPPTNQANGLGDKDGNNHYSSYNIGKYNITLLQSEKVVLTDYALKSEFSKYVTKTDAGNTYLTKATAQSDYLTKADSAELYPTRSEVSQTLQQMRGEIEGTHVKKSEVGVAYSSVNESLTITLPTA